MMLTYIATVGVVAFRIQKVSIYVPKAPKNASYIHSTTPRTTTTVVTLTYSVTVVIVAFTIQKATKNAGEFLARALVE